MKEVVLAIKENHPLTSDVYRLVLAGKIDTMHPGQFVNLKIPGYYLRRPISICDANKNQLTLIYKVVGKGTDKLSKLHTEVNVLTSLGNGYNLTNAKKHNLLVGGGVGIPPLYFLAKELKRQKKDVTVILGFNKKNELFYVNEFKKLGVKVIVTTLDGSVGVKGLVTDAMKKLHYDYVYACGPIPMLKAVYTLAKVGEYSLEERMGCGFGACMGCTIKTEEGAKRVCKDGPVFLGKEIIW
ncbi:MAG: dihydroorotate dehydrogenase electron transfer subunit [Bacilli bacterium]|nr:dihydroorotate dehydrogenase electron transfer subunit [Bacilli bacterium]